MTLTEFPGEQLPPKDWTTAHSIAESVRYLRKPDTSASEFILKEVSRQPEFFKRALESVGDLFPNAQQEMTALLGKNLKERWTMVEQNPSLVASLISLMHAYKAHLASQVQ